MNDFKIKVGNRPSDFNNMEFERLQTLPLDGLLDRDVLVLGPDNKFLSIECTNRGAKVQIPSQEIGKQYPNLGKFDIILCISNYYHLYKNTGFDHLPIWYWFYNQCSKELIWNNPVSGNDLIVQLNIDVNHQARYNLKEILAHAELYFNHEHVSNSKFGEVFRFIPKQVPIKENKIYFKSTAKISPKLAHQFSFVLNETFVPERLLYQPEGPFDWSINYYRAHIDDMYCRLYPITIGLGTQGYIVRFENDSSNNLKIISNESIAKQTWITN